MFLIGFLFIFSFTQAQSLHVVAQSVTPFTSYVTAGDLVFVQQDTILYMVTRAFAIGQNMNVALALSSYRTVASTGSQTIYGDFTINGRLVLNDGGYSVIIGELAGENDDGSNNYNTFVGTLSGQLTSLGSLNVAIGAQTMQLNTFGKQNSSLGGAAFSNNIIGDYNVALGYTAGAFIVGGVNTASDYGVYLGFEARASSDSLTNEVVIGANAIGNGENTATILDDNGTDVYMGENAQANVRAIAFYLTDSTYFKTIGDTICGVNLHTGDTVRMVPSR